jgi:hypothetical protein
MQLTDLSLNRNLYKTLQDISTQGADQLASNVAPMPSSAVASGNTVQDLNTNAQLINGAQLEPGTYPTTTLDIANWGWNQTCNFSVTDDNTIGWVGGSFISADGTAYSIVGGDTGNMGAYPAKTYVYLDINVSLTAYQITTSVNTCTGIGKVLIAVCQSANVVSTGATFNLVQASQITADNILANSINANKIIAGSITTAQLSATAIDAMTITGALIRTAATGARLEMDGSTNLFKAYDATALIMSIGAPTGNSILRITPNSTTYEGIYITQSTTSASAKGILLERTSGAVGPSIYVTSTSGTSGSIFDLNNAGSGDTISITQGGAGKVLNISSFASGSNPAIAINNSGTQPSISLTNSSTTTNNAALYITKSGYGTNIELNSTANSANPTYGITFDLNNSGVGLEHAFRFVGSEVVTSSLDKMIRIMVGTTVYYFPCYNSNFDFGKFKLPVGTNLY